MVPPIYYIEKYDTISGFEFEDMVYLLYKKIYGDLCVLTSRSNDGGKDIIVKGKFYIECKHHKSKIGRPDIQKFHSACIDGRTNGIFISYSGFSKEGSLYANKHNINLVDGNEFKKKFIDIFDITDTNLLYTMQRIPSNLNKFGGEFIKPTISYNIVKEKLYNISGKSSVKVSSSSVSPIINFDINDYYRYDGTKTNISYYKKIDFELPELDIIDNTNIPFSMDTNEINRIYKYEGSYRNLRNQLYNYILYPKLYISHVYAMHITEYTSYYYKDKKLEHNMYYCKFCDDYYSYVRICKKCGCYFCDKHNFNKHNDIYIGFGFCPDCIPLEAKRIFDKYPQPSLLPYKENPYLWKFL
jgi:hypothetical protein